MSLADARAITSAPSGRVLSTGQASIASLTNAQKTALGNLVTSFGAAWPGNPNYITHINLWRVDGNPLVIGASMEGVIVHNDAATAINQLTSGATNSIIGIVP